MATGIEWTNETWNPVSGCTRVTAGCDNCYAVGQTYRCECMGQEKYAGLSIWSRRPFRRTARLRKPPLYGQCARREAIIGGKGSGIGLPGGISGGRAAIRQLSARADAPSFKRLAEPSETATVLTVAAIRPPVGAASSDDCVWAAWILVHNTVTRGLLANVPCGVETRPVPALVRVPTNLLGCANHTGYEGAMLCRTDETLTK